MKSKDISNKLEIIKNAILNAVKVKYIYHFGSYVYGKPKKDSDIDIYVVIPDAFYEGLTVMMGKILENLSNYDFSNVDLFLVKETIFLKRKEYSSFEGIICEKGVLIYEN